MKNLPVAELMEKDPVTTRPEAPLTELVGQMQRYRVRAMPVVADDRKLRGVVSETDLFLKARGVPFSLEKVPTLLGRVIAEDELVEFEPCQRVKVEEVMTTAPVSVPESTTLEQAAMLMYERKFSLLPVVDGEGRLVGVVRRIDLLNRIYAAV